MGDVLSGSWELIDGDLIRFVDDGVVTEARITSFSEESFSLSIDLKDASLMQLDLSDFPSGSSLDISGTVKATFSR